MRREATRVLVTGGAGFIGSALVRALVAAGHSVRVLDDLSTGSRARLTGLAVELLQADVRNPAAVRRALEGAEVVFHLAGQDAGDVLRAEEVNVQGTLNLLHGAHETRPQRVVVASSGVVYGRAHVYLLHEEVPPLPATTAAVQHLAAEHYARVYHEVHRLPTVALRLFPTFGPGDPWEGARPRLVPLLCQAALTGAAPLIVGDPRQTRDLVYVDNAVAAFLAAASVPSVEGQVFNIASGEAVSVGNLWSLICELAGRRREAQAPTYSPAPPWEPAHVRVSIARAARSLGYAPAVRLREGLRRVIEHYRSAARDQRPTGENAWFSPPLEAIEAVATPPPQLAMPAPPAPSYALGQTPLPSRAVRANGWPRPTRSVPPPPPPPAHALARPAPPPLPVPVELPTEEIELDPDPDPDPDTDLDIEWAPVPAPWGSR